MQARLIKGIQKPRPEFETVGACLIMLHGISDTGANFECWYVEFLGHQEQHLDPNTSVGRSWHRWSQKSYILSSSLIIESEGARTATP